MRTSFSFLVALMGAIAFTFFNLAPCTAQNDNRISSTSATAKPDTVIEMDIYFLRGQGLNKAAKQISSPQIVGLLAQAGITGSAIRPTHPNFRESDTLGVNERGHRFKRANYSNLMTIQLPQKKGNSSNASANNPHTITPDSLLTLIRSFPFVLYASTRTVVK